MTTYLEPPCGPPRPFVDAGKSTGANVAVLAAIIKSTFPDAVVESHAVGLFNGIVVLDDLIGFFNILVLQDLSGVLLPHSELHADLVEIVADERVVDLDSEFRWEFEERKRANGLISDCLESVQVLTERWTDRR